MLRTLASGSFMAVDIEEGAEAEDCQGSSECLAVRHGGGGEIVGAGKLVVGRGEGHAWGRGAPRGGRETTSGRV